ncbi:hypothetical protein T05_2292, partial [Trichinella murrelli]
LINMRMDIFCQFQSIKMPPALFTSIAKNGKICCFIFTFSRSFYLRFFFLKKKRKNFNRAVPTVDVELLRLKCGKLEGKKIIVFSSSKNMTKHMR